jgi:hypothetical protein
MACVVCPTVREVRGSSLGPMYAWHCPCRCDLGWRVYEQHDRVAGLLDDIEPGRSAGAEPRHSRAVEPLTSSVTQATLED